MFSRAKPKASSREPSGSPAANLDRQPSAINGWNILHQSVRLNLANLDRFDRHRPAASTGTNVLRPIASKECVICADESAQRMSEPPTDRCTHEPETCVACLRQVLKVAIVDERKVDGIQCPGIECRQPLEHKDVQKWADAATFERYNDLVVQYLLRDEGGYVTCINPACGAGQVHAGENIFPIVTCYRCGHKTCYRHRVEWHEGWTCKEWDRREERWATENQLSQQWVASQTKRCPGPGCNRPVRKEEGCDHVTCHKPGGCGFEFCWYCLAPYGPIRNEGNQRHRASCLYYSSYRPPPPPVPAVVPRPSPRPRHRWFVWRGDNATTTPPPHLRF